MLPLPNLLAISACTLMGLGLIISFLRITFNGGSFLGKPSAQALLFYTGKLSIFFSIGLLVSKAVIPSFGGVEVHGWMSWLGASLASIGAIITVISFFNLSDSLKYGLPDETTKLKTTGLFRYSRNPLYMGIFLVNIGSALFFPVTLNILVSLYCIVSHIILIRGEEKFLAERFGKEWTAYTTKVRRYL